MIAAVSGVPALAIVGWSGCGKTTLIERLLPFLEEYGLRVAVVKHTQHKLLQTDVAGSDTHRFWEAGAICTVLVGADRIVRTERMEQEPSLNHLLDSLTGFDLVLVEGYKRSTLPKIEVLRTTHSVQPIADVSNRIAWVTDRGGLSPLLPTFALDAIEDLAGFILDFVHDYRHTHGELAGT